MRVLTDAFRAYFFALGVALRAVLRGRFKEGGRLWWTPVGYWRFWPFAYAYQEFKRYKNPKVLDVSSPKLLGLLLASETSAPVRATDLDDEKIFSRWKPLARSARLDNYAVEYQDARKLAYPDESFDFVYSISVIEHIPGDGDREALAEFSRVLKPGGTLVVEVPFRRTREDVFLSHDSKGAPTETPRFYERHYDAALLSERLKAGGLALVKRVILGERTPLDPWLVGRRLPRPLRAALLPLEPWLAALNCRALANGSGHPGSAVLVYRKD